MGDLRDASEVGVSTAEIARGSLAFAATYTRPLSRWSQVSDRTAALWVRVAVALSFSSAIVSISQYSIFATSSGSDSSSIAGLVVLASTQLLAAFMVLAPLLSLVVVFTTRGTEGRLRLSVSLLAVATVLPMTRPGIALLLPGGDYYTSPATVVFPIAIALVIAAGTILTRMYHPFARPKVPQRLSRRLLISTIAGLLVVAIVVAGSVSMTGVWEARTPLVFGLPLNEENRAFYTQWVQLKFQFERMVSMIFGLWIVVGLAIACLIAASGFSSRATRQRSTMMLGIVIFSSAVTFGGIFALLQMATGPTVTTSIELLIAAGRWGLVGIIITAILRTGTRSAAHHESAER
ncbi:MAG: hypothetical protein V4531_08360 [Actinomycetota bacterium]